MGRTMHISDDPYHHPKVGFVPVDFLEVALKIKDFERNIKEWQFATP
jgi:hypothetical protein